MSHPRARRLLSRLALVAMLLLATLPTLGRLALEHPPSHVMAMAGHAMPVATHGQATHGQAPQPAPAPHHHGEDCDYCVLLSGAVPTSVVVHVVAPAPPARWVAPARRAVAFVAHAGPGLGARGPPPVA